MPPKRRVPTKPPVPHGPRAKSLVKPGHLWPMRTSEKSSTSSPSPPVVKEKVIPRRERRKKVAPPPVPEPVEEEQEDEFAAYAQGLIEMSEEEED